MFGKRFGRIHKEGRSTFSSFSLSFPVGPGSRFQRAYPVHLPFRVPQYLFAIVEGLLQPSRSDSALHWIFLIILTYWTDLGTCQ